MATLLADLGTVATKSLTMVADIADKIVDTPLLCVGLDGCEDDVNGLPGSGSYVRV